MAIIRPARIEDIPKIVELTVQLLELHHNIDPEYYRFESDYTGKLKSWAESQLNSDSQFILVHADESPGLSVVDGYISGYIKYLFPWFEIKSVGHISFLVVDKNIKRQGIGRKLETAAEKWFRARRIEYIEVYTNERNLTGSSAWSAYGYGPFNKFLRKKITNSGP